MGFFGPLPWGWLHFAARPQFTSFIVFLHGTDKQSSLQDSPQWTGPFKIMSFQTYEGTNWLAMLAVAVELLSIHLMQTGLCWSRHSFVHCRCQIKKILEGKGELESACSREIEIRHLNDIGGWKTDGELLYLIWLLVLKRRGLDNCAAYLS